MIATIEASNNCALLYDLQPDEAEAIDNENAAIIHDDQQPLTSFGGGGGARNSTSMSSFGTNAQDATDR